MTAVQGALFWQVVNCKRIILKKAFTIETQSHRDKKQKELRENMNSISLTIKALGKTQKNSVISSVSLWLSCRLSPCAFDPGYTMILAKSAHS